MKNIVLFIAFSLGFSLYTSAQGLQQNSNRGQSIYNNNSNKINADKGKKIDITPKSRNGYGNSSNRRGYGNGRPGTHGHGNTGHGHHGNGNTGHGHHGGSINININGNGNGNGGGHHHNGGSCGTGHGHGVGHGHGHGVGHGHGHGVGHGHGHGVGHGHGHYVNNWVPCTYNSFCSIINQIKVYTFETDRRRKALQLTQCHHFSTAQIRQILSLFCFESNRLTVAKAAYHTSCDPYNYHLLFDCFTFQSNVRSLNDYISCR